MKSYSPFTETYVQDICDALNKVGYTMVSNETNADGILMNRRIQFAPENFETLTKFLQDYIVRSLDCYLLLNPQGLVNRGRCPYTGQKIDSTFPSWSFERSRRVYLSHEGFTLMKKEDDESYERIYGHPPVSQTNKKGCYIATVCYGSESAPEVLLLKKFRDYKLSKILLGRAFISFYYFVSPWLAEKLKERYLLNKLIRKVVLDNLIKIIQRKWLG